MKSYSLYIVWTPIHAAPKSSAETYPISDDAPALKIGVAPDVVNRYRKSIDIIDIDRFNPPIDIDWHRKSIEIELTENNNLSIIIN